MRSIRRSLSFSREPKGGSNAPPPKAAAAVPLTPGNKLKRSLSFGNRTRSAAVTVPAASPAAVPTVTAEPFKRLTASEVAAGAQLAPSTLEVGKKLGAPLQKRSNSFGRIPRKERPPTPPAIIREPGGLPEAGLAPGSHRRAFPGGTAGASAPAGAASCIASGAAFGSGISISHRISRSISRNATASRRAVRTRRPSGPRRRPGMRTAPTTTATDGRTRDRRRGCSRPTPRPAD